MHLLRSVAWLALAVPPREAGLAVVDPVPALPAWGPPDFTRPKAVVLWHGLGDHYNSTGMRRAAALVRQLMPETYVHTVALDVDPAVDERLLLFGDANHEVQAVCEQLSRVPELNEGFGAIGFSQGGLFLRALIERCPNVSVSTLVTFGLPHMGVAELPLCGEGDWLCRRRNALLRGQVWNRGVQRLVVPAQYFRDPLRYGQYIKFSNFLADVNNERAALFDAAAKLRLARLRRLVLVQFDRDTTLVPKESAVFGERDPATQAVLGFNSTRVYKEDLVGLKLLHRDKRVDILHIDDDHMRIPDAFFVDIVSKYFANGL